MAPDNEVAGINDGRPYSRQDGSLCIWLEGILVLKPQPLFKTSKKLFISSSFGGNSKYEYLTLELRMVIWPLQEGVWDEGNA
ncbi:hypothetical protein E4T56_gene6583 [Termitomyces sp. T112]|nr:hypothetical protein E4T56_gene6583 [Termitomyces sp. T112]